MHRISNYTISSSVEIFTINWFSLNRIVNLTLASKWRNNNNNQTIVCTVCELVLSVWSHQTCDTEWWYANDRLKNHQENVVQVHTFPNIDWTPEQQTSYKLLWIICGKSKCILNIMEKKSEPSSYSAIVYRVVYENNTSHKSTGK